MSRAFNHLRQTVSRLREPVVRLWLRVRDVIGLLLVVTGVLTFVAGYLFGLTNYNALLFAGLGQVVAGIILYIIVMKRKSLY